MFLKESVDIDNHRWKSAKAFWVSRVIKNISRAKPFEFKWPEVLLISKNNKFSLRRSLRVAAPSPLKWNEGKGAPSPPFHLWRGGCGCRPLDYKYESIKRRVNSTCYIISEAYSPEEIIFVRELGFIRAWD